MTIIESFVEPVNKGYWDSPPLSGYIYRNLLDNQHLTNLKKEIYHIIQNDNKTTFLTNSAVLNHDGKKFKIGSNSHNNRYQNVLYDISFHTEYWYQTQDSIYDWGLNAIKQTASPNFLKFIYKMTSLTPFDTKEYLPYRLHINYLPENEGLGIHVDSNPIMYINELEDINQYSLTFYTEDSLENEGGEIYTLNGWSYKPKSNTAIAMNGHQVGHAVTHNMSKEPRLAFTIRWAKITDLFLPGHPNKHVWKVNYDS